MLEKNAGERKSVLPSANHFAPLSPTLLCPRESSSSLSLSRSESASSSAALLPIPGFCSSVSRVSRQFADTKHWAAARAALVSRPQSLNKTVLSLEERSSVDRKMAVAPALRSRGALKTRRVSSAKFYFIIIYIFLGGGYVFLVDRYGNEKEGRTAG